MWAGNRMSRSPFPSAAVLMLLLAPLLGACASGGSASGGGDPTQVAFAPELGIVLDQMTLTPDGLYYADLEVGTGMKAREGDRVTLHYKGWLPDGTVFDSSTETNEPIVFIVGEKQVIRGWELGIAGMKVGGQRVLVIPPALAYGSRGVRDVVPRNATLVFTVRLMSVGEGYLSGGPTN